MDIFIPFVWVYSPGLFPFRNIGIGLMHVRITGIYFVEIIFQKILQKVINPYLCSPLIKKDSRNGSLAQLV